MYTNDKEKTVLAFHRSDGSELIPSEIQAKTHEEESKSLNVPRPVGSTVDDEGITNVYAVEPAVSLTEYPSPKQQQHYLFLGIGAILFVAVIVLIEFTVS